MYSLLRPLLFRLDPETSHHLGLCALNLLDKARASALLAAKVPNQEVKVMGLSFPNPVGLAAGLDKDGDYFNALGRCGFGFVEIGTVTPRPQPGNEKPRLFRLPEHEAIINRMGFNNKGVAHLVERVKQRRYPGILGINIGKNATTPVAEAEDDYRTGMQMVYPWADYITVNISSPNTPGLRSLQYGESLRRLLDSIKQEQGRLTREHQRYVPIAIKIAPDVSLDEIQDIAAALVESGMDGVIATNTTLEREAVKSHRHGSEAGGLSGAPLTQRSTEVIQALNSELHGRMPIIGVGGIMSGADAVEKIRAGASLVQLYSGFIYRGPALVAEVAAALREASQQ